jgi:DNA polymerase III alpha subunit
MPYAPFVPLRVLSSYSMLEGAIDPKAIAKLAKERGFPAHRDLRPQRALRNARVCLRVQGRGVQPIVGTLLGVARGAGRRSTTCRSTRKMKRLAQPVPPRQPRAPRPPLELDPRPAAAISKAHDG